MKSYFSTQGIEKELVVELMCFPPIALFLLWRERMLIVDRHEHYQKRSFRNRYEILTGQGRYTLSIPLRKGKHQGQRITEVRIAYDRPWIHKHLHTIRSAYGRAPYFEIYFPTLEQLYRSCPSHLFEWNLNALRWCMDALQWDLSYRLSDTFHATSTDVVEVYRDVLTPRNAPQIPLPPYPQVFEDRFGFVTNLSVLDLIFNLGPEAHSYLKAHHPLLSSWP